MVLHCISFLLSLCFSFVLATCKERPLHWRVWCIRVIGSVNVLVNVFIKVEEIFIIICLSFFISEIDNSW